MKKNIITLLGLAIIAAVWAMALPFVVYPAGSIVQLRGIQVQDVSGSPIIGLNRPQYVDAVVLTANTAATYTFPTGKKYALFSATADFYVSYSGTAVVPSTNVTDGTGPELNPVMRQVDGLTSVSIISPSSCVVTVAIYK